MMTNILHDDGKMVKNEYFYLTVEEPVEAPVEAHLQPVPVPFPTTTQRKPTAGMTKVAPPLEDLLVLEDFMLSSLFVQLCRRYRF